MDATNTQTIGCFDDDAGRNILNYLEKLGSDLNAMSDEFCTTAGNIQISVKIRINIILMFCSV